MKESNFIFFLTILLINAFIPTNESFLKLDSLGAEEKMYSIEQEIAGDSNHKKADYDFTTTADVKNIFFKYQSTNPPSSLITTFRIEFDAYGSDISNYNVYCTNVFSTETDDGLKAALKALKPEDSSCIDILRAEAKYDGLIRLDKDKTKLGIMIQEANSGLSFSGRVNLRVKERTLETSELKPNDEEKYTLVPFTIDLPKFRSAGASKVLFYSFSKNLQMFYAGTVPYPDSLFSGNILSVYTNPNMIRQKYHDASLMTLLVQPSENSAQDFHFEAKLFESNYLLDYYVGSNPEGRTLNTPLLINMTECTSPYYIILNYNKQDSRKSLILDQIYGKVKSISIATEFTKSTWDEMIANNMAPINLVDRKHELPGYSKAHIDVYKVECEFPVMLNFYYVDDYYFVEKMNYGDVNIYTLSPYESLNLAFSEDLRSPEIIIEIYNPIYVPTVIISADNETVYQSNTLVKLVPSDPSNGVLIKERAGLSLTRIIVKVGYSTADWSSTSDPNVQYNSKYDIYAFKFPVDQSKYNYTIAFLNTSGTDEDNNVKYCFTTNIGAALKPSSENCYRISESNPYCLKVYNPLNMYKDYNYDDSYAYYVTFKTETTPKQFSVKAFMMTYDTTNRMSNGESSKVAINSGKAKYVLSALKDNFLYTALQIQVCDKTNAVKAKIKQALTEEEVVPEMNIPANSKNKNFIYKNILVDSEVEITGSDNTNIFLRYAGLPTSYEPSFRDNYKVTFDSSTNTLIIEQPVTKEEFMSFTVIVDKENVIKNKDYTLCDFVTKDFDKLGLYHKSVTTIGVGSIQINFNKIGLSAGQKFDAIVYIEQQMYSKMAFLSDVIQGTVGQITIDAVHEIVETYPQDNDYSYLTLEGKSSELNYYFSFLPDKLLDIPFGALRIELDDSSTGSFSAVYCSFANNDSDAFDRIEAVEELISTGESYCIGGRSNTNSKKYNYIFKYDKNKDDNTPKMLVIKIVNGNSTNGVNGKFNIYVRKEPGVEVTKTDFTAQKIYGEDENNKKSLIPYIVDLIKIRGEETDENKISKILFYSRNSELQMYYIPEDDKVPIKLFNGNIALAYTKPELAIQKYHATTLILISQDLVEDAVEDSFRFHTKMFRSEDQIEFFVSQNPQGRTLNFPLSFEMNVCTSTNKKLYYLLNYNRPEPLRNLHLEMVFGAYSRARIAREIAYDTWDNLLSSGMSEIENYQTYLPEKSQHIDVIEIECISPLLINAYYTYDNYPYQNVRPGEIVVRDLLPTAVFKFTTEPQKDRLFYYSLSLFNSLENPNITIRFSDGYEENIFGNILKETFTEHTPTEISIANNIRTKTRFIFKVGLNVENGNEWKKDTSAKIDGTLFVNNNVYVYKFPFGYSSKSYTKVDFTVNGINAQVENVKFCYSTNLGVAMDTSKENCFRTGKDIPYTLTFINPQIVSKNYETSIDKYYITFRPFLVHEYIKLDITENKYETTSRNDEGYAKQITLVEKKASSILSLPLYHTNNILIQIRACAPLNYPLSYKLYNAFTQEFLKEGKTYFYKDIPYGIIVNTESTYLETEVKFEANQDETTTPISAFLKHTAIGSNRIIFQEGYTEISFDDTKNSISFKKPIINEEFIVTIIVDYRGALEKYTQCDLAFTDKSRIGKYSKSFISVSSNLLVHFIDFGSFNFIEGTEFDLLVYIEERYNFKLEFLYPLFQGKVGKLSGVETVQKYTEDNRYATLNFQYDLNSNYLSFDFPRTPTGKVASLKILSPTAKVNKVGCVFVSKNALESTMISAVNSAMVENKNKCLDLGSKSKNEFNALINADYFEDNNRLVIQVLYDPLDNNNEDLKIEEITINIKVSGDTFGDYYGEFDFDEKLAPTPYVVNLEDIRQKKVNDKYVSKLLLYSSTTKMSMHYISDQSTVPIKLFEGNIMLIYTNPDLIYQKYNNAKIMILTTDAIGQTQNVLNVKYFDSDAQIQYYLGSNPEGRVLNNPTAIEMTSCNLPYYYILNYNKVEDGPRILHLDTIFGETESIKIATSLDYTSWDKLVENMVEFDAEQIILPETTNYPFDILEVKCKIPLLINLYYVDPNNIKTEDIDLGDIVILTLSGGAQQTLNLKKDLVGIFAYSFNAFKGYNELPDIRVSFANDPDSDFLVTKNGLHVLERSTNYQSITIENLDRSSGLSTRIIFKFGYVIESIFEHKGNGVYQNINDPERNINLYAYRYDIYEKKLNYSGVDLEISTNEDNVKFCYSTNIGTYITPSITNCYRVGKNNPYTISTRNPFVMYRNYYYENNNNYYVGFRTIEINQNIVITPKPIAYGTIERNLEGVQNKVTIIGDSEKSEYSTILTSPEKGTAYLFTHIHVCTKGQPLSYEFYNAYNGTYLGYKGYIMADTSFNYLSVPNTKLDTELKLMGNKDVEVFVKHVGVEKQYYPVVNPIKFNYNSTTHLLSWSQPIDGESFKYSIYIDKIGNILNKGYTLCSIVDISKLGRYSTEFTTNLKSPYLVLDFTNPDLVDCKEFDVIIVAEQTYNGKLTILSPVYNSRGESSDDKKQEEPKKDDDGGSNTGLIIIIIILSVIIIAGGVIAFFIVRKYKSKTTMVQDGKATSMAMLGNTQNDKLVESQAQVDP